MFIMTQAVETTSKVQRTAVQGPVKSPDLAIEKSLARELPPVDSYTKAPSRMAALREKTGAAIGRTFRPSTTGPSDNLTPVVSPLRHAIGTGVDTAAKTTLAISAVLMITAGLGLLTGGAALSLGFGALVTLWGPLLLAVVIGAGVVSAARTYLRTPPAVVVDTSTTF
jgi:hypothetical protein